MIVTRWIRCSFATSIVEAEAREAASFECINHDQLTISISQQS
jgi:hypothetical protein